jgi:RNA polymerase sigma-70 factor (ECF subfamily)
MPSWIVHATTEMSRALELFRDEIIELLPRLRRFARAITRNPHDADDLVQATVERALRRFDQWQEEARLESWMFGIMRNAWIDEVRARVRRDRVHAPAEAGENVGTQSTDVEAIALQSALEQLPDEQRMAVGLVLIEGFSYKEAAAVLEVPIGTLTSRLARARDALAVILDEGQP